MDETVKSSKLPKKIARYEIKSELGRGGMATVYLGYDDRFDREVAIKVLPAEFLHDPQFSVRFHREAKTIAKLEHSAIVPVYDVGEADGLPFFVMRLMDGGSLDDVLEKGDLPIREAARMISVLAPALDEAHRQGIIHRDLKPGNILFDHAGQPYLSDFGIAKTSDAQTNVTGSAIIGTPAYMSPEQAQGMEIDGRSDLYTLGAIVYRMLSGARPYQGDTPMSMAIKHITEPPPDILQDKSNLPVSTANFIYRAMAKNPDERFQTAVELAEALNLLAEDEFAKLPAPAKTMFSRTKISSPRKKAVAPAKKKKPIGWIVAGIAIILLGGAGLLSKFLFPASSPELSSTPTAEAIAQATATEAALPEASPTVEAAPSEIPSPTLPPEPVGPPVLGGADKIAFVANNNVWMMNVDGNELEQLTTDGTVKSNLQWLPDGETLTYIAGKCVWSIDVPNGVVDIVSCYNSAEYLEGFSVSPDSQYVALSMNREMYILPFDLAVLKDATTRAKLFALSGCYFDNLSVKDALWSEDSKMVALKFLGVSGNSRVDMVRVVDVSSCLSAPQVLFDITPVPFPRLDEFPGARFTMSGYSGASPYIVSYDWDGNELFVMNTNKRNGGFGYMYRYNMISHKAEEIIPVDNNCCYRDARLSPDGSYMAFAFQDIRLGADAKIELYYVLYGTLGSGANYEPIPLPEDFFTDTRDAPQFALRPAK